MLALSFLYAGGLSSKHGSAGIETLNSPSYSFRAFRFVGGLCAPFALKGAPSSERTCNHPALKHAGGSKPTPLLVDAFGALAFRYFK